MNSLLFVFVFVFVSCFMFYVLFSFFVDEKKLKNEMSSRVIESLPITRGGAKNFNEGKTIISIYV